MRHFYAKLSICLMVLSGLWSTLSAQTVLKLDNFNEATTSIGLSIGESVAQGFTTGPDSTYQNISIDLTAILALEYYSSKGKSKEGPFAINL